MDSSTGLPRGTARRISTGPASWPAWSPDGRRIAYAIQDSGRFRIAIVPFNGGEETVVYDSPGSGGDLAWSPDAQYLFAGAGNPPTANRLRVHVTTRHADTLPNGPIRILGYTPDGRLVAHYEGDNLVISSATTGAPVQKIQLPSRVVPTGWSHTVPGGITAIEHVVPSHFERVTLADGRIQSLGRPDTVSLDQVRFSPDGKQIAYTARASSTGRLYVANPDGSGLRAIGNRGDYGAFKWSPNGKQIAYVNTGSPLSGFSTAGIHIVDVASGDDREVRRSTEGAGPGADIGWKSDGQTLRYIWRPRGLTGNERELREVTLSGADRLLATIENRDGNPNFVNDTLLLLRRPTGVDAVSLRTGTIRPLYTGSMRGRSEIGVSADGSWIAFSANRGEEMYPQLVSLKTGEARAIPYPLKGEISTIFFHPDGRNLITSSCLSCFGDYVEKWDVVLLPMNGDSPRVLTQSQASYKDFGDPRVSPDGRQILFEAEQSYNTRIVTLTFPKSLQP
jgi:Tol biopolymer transport system component